MTDHRGHTIRIAAKLDAKGRCCDATFVIHRTGLAEALFSGTIGASFASIKEAEAEALRKAKIWIDERVGRSVH